MGRKSRLRGFTLLELMVVVAMLGVLAAVAIPAYTAYMRRSKSAEVASNLNSMFKSLATYYTLERTGIGTSGTAAGGCVVDDAGPAPANPGSAKQPFVADAAFASLGFSIADLVYFSYGIASVRGSLTADCGQVTASTASVYTVFANGDLDDDNIESTFEMVVSTDTLNQMFHSIGLYINLEDE